MILPVMIMFVRMWFFISSVQVVNYLEEFFQVVAQSPDAEFGHFTAKVEVVPGVRFCQKLNPWFQKCVCIAGKPLQIFLRRMQKNHC